MKKQTTHRKQLTSSPNSYINHSAKKSDHFDEYLSKQIERVIDGQTQTSNILVQDHIPLQNPLSLTTNKDCFSLQSFKHLSAEDRVNQLEEQLFMQDKDHKKKFHIMIGLNEHLKKEIEMLLSQQNHIQADQFQASESQPTKRLLLISPSNQIKNDGRSTSPHSSTTQLQNEIRKLQNVTRQAEYSVQIAEDNSITKMQAVDQQKNQQLKLIDDNPKSKQKHDVRKLLIMKEQSDAPMSGKLNNDVFVNLEGEIDSISEDLIEKLQRMKHLIIQQQQQIETLETTQQSISSPTSKQKALKIDKDVLQQLSALKNNFTRACQGQNYNTTKSPINHNKQKPQIDTHQVTLLINEMNTILKTSVLLDMNVFKQKEKLLAQSTELNNSIIEQVDYLKKKLNQKKFNNGQLKQRIIDMDKERNQILLQQSENPNDCDGKSSNLINQWINKCNQQQSQIKSLLENSQNHQSETKQQEYTNQIMAKNQEQAQEIRELTKERDGIMEINQELSNKIDQLNSKLIIIEEKFQNSDIQNGLSLINLSDDQQQGEDVEHQVEFHNSLINIYKIELLDYENSIKQYIEDSLKYKSELIQKDELIQELKAQKNQKTLNNGTNLDNLDQTSIINQQAQKIEQLSENLSLLQDQMCNLKKTSQSQLTFLSQNQQDSQIKINSLQVEIYEQEKLNSDLQIVNKKKMTINFEQKKYFQIQIEEYQNQIRTQEAFIQELQKNKSCENNNHEKQQN